MALLPYDVLSEIAEQLHHSRPALSAFASSSKMLHSAGKRHLFRRVDLKSGERLDEFISLLGQSPHLAPWVNELSLVVRDKNTIHALSMTSSHWAFRALGVLPDMLPQMRTLEIRGLHLVHDSISSSFASHFSRCTVVRRISLFGCYFPKSFLQQVVSVLPQLSNLRLMSVILLRDSQPFKVQEPPDVRIKSIECSAFTAGMAEEFIAWVMNATSISDSLRSVTLHESGLDTSHKLIPLLGATLECFNVVTSDVRGPPIYNDPAIHHVDLSRSTGIRELGFNRTQLADVYILVSRLPRPSMLQTLSYTINGHDREHLKEGCLRKLDTYLARHCTSLKRFILRCDSSGDESGELAIRSFLPESSKKGILHLTIQGNHTNTEKIDIPVRKPQECVPVYHYGFPSMRYH